MSGEPRRAKFQTRANVTPEELKNMEQSTVVKNALEKGNPMVDIPVSFSKMEAVVRESDYCRAPWPCCLAGTRTGTQHAPRTGLVVAQHCSIFHCF